MQFVDLFYVILLGIIEGVTEWLPISSTGHLLLVEKLFINQLNPKIFTEAFNEMFSVLIQLGAILAVVGIFFKRLWPFRNDRKTRLLLWAKLLVATIPAALIGLIFDDLIASWLNNPLSISCTLIIYGVLFIVVEKKTKKVKVNDVKNISFKLALIVGLAQTLALIPGTSRSGITIITMLLLSINRQTSTEFSFLLSVPIMFGASSLKLIKFIAKESFLNSQLILLAIGMLIALMVSIIVIKFLLGFIKKHDFTGFGIYRICLGILIVILWFFKLF